MQSIYTPHFRRIYEKLNKTVKDLVKNKENLFRHNPFDPRLRTHKLHGGVGNLWSFSVGYKYRIIFEFDSRELVYFHEVGDHSVYDRL